MTHKNSLLYCTTLHSSPAVCALYSLVPITVLSTPSTSSCLPVVLFYLTVLIVVPTDREVLPVLLHLLTGECFLLKVPPDREVLPVVPTDRELLPVVPTDRGVLPVVFNPNYRTS